MIRKRIGGECEPMVTETLLPFDTAITVLLLAHVQGHALIQTSQVSHVHRPMEFSWGLLKMVCSYH
jgi:hypothetical protein